MSTIKRTILLLLVFSVKDFIPVSEASPSYDASYVDDGIYDTDRCLCGMPNRDPGNSGNIWNRILTRYPEEGETEENEYPWMVAVQGCAHGMCYSCGGSLIDDRTVLTAAHCLFSKDGEELTIDQVWVGSHHKGEDGSIDGEAIPVGSKTRHPEYIGHMYKGYYDYDFAILTLSRPVRWRREVRPICLPTSRLSDYEHVRAIVTGWGDTVMGEKSQSPVLKEVEVQTMWNNDECAMKWNPQATSPGGRITKNMICTLAKDRGGWETACMGDSGGPLITRKSGWNQEQYELIGVVSFGKLDCGIPGIPAMFARVTSVLPWIRGHMRGETCPAK